MRDKINLTHFVSQPSILHRATFLEAAKSDRGSAELPQIHAARAEGRSPRSARSFRFRPDRRVPCAIIALLSGACNPGTATVGVEERLKPGLWVWIISNVRGI
jgi:hypothetical protein